MKKVILSALALAVCGVLPNAALAQGLTDHYLITYYRSVTTANPGDVRSATVVTVINLNSVESCQVAVQWLPDNRFSQVGISGPVEVGPFASAHFCSRFVNQGITDCDRISEPRLTGAGIRTQGKAIVSSSTRTACDFIAVDARVYYTIAVEGGGETLAAISNPKIINLGLGFRNQGD
jgi:hypothetical protein